MNRRSYKGKGNPMYGRKRPDLVKWNKKFKGKTLKEMSHKKDCQCSFCKDHSGKNNVWFGKPAQHGKRLRYRRVWMRSSYEVVYAKYLDRKRVEWQYEPIHFDLGNKTYTPDFYLPKKNLYIEIKGYWYERAIKKFRRFKKLYPQIKIKVLRMNDLQEIGVL